MQRSSGALRCSIESQRTELAAHCIVLDGGKMDAAFQVALEYVDSELPCHRFRVAFDSSNDRYLLSYPESFGLCFAKGNASAHSEWKTRYIVSAPRNKFVLRPLDRIAFDLRAFINVEPTHERLWTIQLSPGEYDVHYVYTAKPDMRRYERLAMQSRFAAITKPWGGSIESNSVRFIVPE